MGDTSVRSFRIDQDDLVVLESRNESISSLARELIHNYVVELRLGSPGLVQQATRVRPARLIDRIVWSPWFEGSMIGVLVASVLLLIGTTVWFYGFGPMVIPSP